MILSLLKYLTKNIYCKKTVSFLREIFTEHLKLLEHFSVSEV